MDVRYKSRGQCCFTRTLIDARDRFYLFHFNDGPIFSGGIFFGPDRCYGFGDGDTGFSGVHRIGESNSDSYTDTDCHTKPDSDSHSNAV
jgi:hypothetical protein